MQRGRLTFARKSAGGSSLHLDGATSSISGASSTDSIHDTERRIEADHACGSKKFVIFDQSGNRCRLMVCPPGVHNFNFSATDLPASYYRMDEENECTSFSDGNEDAGDIDALLSLENVDLDDEEVSTGRTVRNKYEACSPESSSTGETCTWDGRSVRSSSFKCTSSSSSQRKREKVKKLLRSLRGIVPGSEQTDAAAVLDDTVRYLKSLKMKAKEFGVGN